MADRFNMFSRSKPLPGWNRQSANADGEYYEGGRLRTIPSDVVTPPLRGDVFTGEELGIESNANGSTLAQPPINRGYVSTGDRDRDITSYLTNTFSDPDEEDRLRRQTRNRMAIMAVGDAIRQLGNIYHTTNYAPSQKFNNPLENEYGRYYTQKRLRDADAYKKYTMQLQKDKLAAEQAQRDFQNQIRKDNLQLQHDKAKQAQENWQKTFDANQKRAEDQSRLNREKFDFQKQKADSDKKLAQERLRLGWANHNLSQLRLAKSGGGRGSSGGRGGSGSNGKRITLTAPSGAAYSFPANTFTGTTGKANINKLYNKMVSVGAIKKRNTLIDGELSDEDKLNEIMVGASNNIGHPWFVFYANRLGYKYEGGMTEDGRQKAFAPRTKKVRKVLRGQEATDYKNKKKKEQYGFTQ